jgi:hypothetical protein
MGTNFAFGDICWQREEEHSMPLNEEGFIDRVSLRHSVSPDAVRTIVCTENLSSGVVVVKSAEDGV